MILAAGLIPPARADTPRLPTGYISEIVIEGAGKISREQILAKLKSHVGRPFDKRQVEEDQQALAKADWFSDVQCFVKDDKKGGVILYFTLVEMPNRPVIAVPASSLPVPVQGQGPSNLDPFTPASAKLAPAYLRDGYDFGKQGSYSRAADSFRRVLDLDPTNFEAHVNLGRTLSVLGFHELAVEEISTGIALTKYNEGWARSARADAYYRAKDDDRAIADYDRIIASNLRKDLGKEYRGRALAWSQKKEFARAIADFSRSIEINPEDGYSYLLRGHAYEQSGNLDLALADFDRALQEDDHKAAAHYGRGQVFARRGEDDRAIAEFDRAVERIPKFVDGRRDRAKLYAARKDWDRAIADLDRVIALQPRLAYDFSAADANEEGVSEETRTLVPKLNIENIDRALLDFRKAAATQPDLHRVVIRRRGKDAVSPKYDRPLFDLSVAIRQKQSAVAEPGAVAEAVDQDQPTEKIVVGFRFLPRPLKLFIKRESIPSDPQVRPAKLGRGGKTGGNLDQFFCLCCKIGEKDQPALAADFLARGSAYLEKGDRIQAENDFQLARKAAINDKDRNEAARRLQELREKKPVSRRP